MDTQAYWLPCITESCITESWLCKEILDQELSISGFQLYRCDRNRHGGGVLLYVSDALQCKRLNVSNCEDLELLSIIVHSEYSKACVSLFYRPPGSAVNLFASLATYLEKINLSDFSCFILLGDFNVDYSNPSYPLFNKLNHIACSFGLEQIITEPTHIHHNHSYSIIDLVFVSNPLLVNSCSIIPPLSSSDHNGILINMRWRSSANYNCPNNSKGRTIWLYDHADWNKAIELIDNCNWESLQRQDVSETWLTWCERFISIMEKCIPRKTLPQRKNLPWLSKKIVQSMRKRNNLYRKARTSGNFSKYKKARNRTTALLRDSRRRYFEKLNPKKPKEFWRAIKYLKKKQSTIPTLTNMAGETASTGNQKANMLNNFFSQCFNRSIPPLLNDVVQSDSESSCPEHLLCSEDTVLDLLLSLDTTKASGPDGISAKMLKNTATSIASSITKIFNQSITTGQVPSGWKSSLVVPIPKTSDALQNPNNYRPISLLSILSKILEKHIYSLIAKHLSEHCPLSDAQWGFIPGRSTVSALLSTVHHWFQLLEDGKEVCAIFLDFKKAFDSVPHIPLVEKLQHIGLNAHLISWIKNYLTARMQQVVVEGATSNPLPVLSGVPQGSVLGPLLFLIYINDITTVSLTESSQQVLYADDVLLYRAITCLADTRAIQRDVEEVQKWADNNHLKLNPTKCKYMLISRKHADVTFTLFLDGIPLERVEVFKYLGVLLRSNLTWSDHITTVCSKARQLLGMLYRQFYNHAPPATIKQLYISLIRPHLEYAAPLWDPHLQRDVNMLENVQKFAMKLITQKWDQGYTQLMEMVDLPTLKNRRLHLKLHHVFRIVHSLCDFPPIFQATSTYCERRTRPHLLHQPFARTNAFLYSFVPSGAAAWNQLTDEQATAGSLQTFKRLLQ